MNYVESRNGGLYVVGSRVSLASIIHAFESGEAPETIQRNFPTLDLPRVYGAIADYLNHPTECAAYLAQVDAAWRELETTARPIVIPQTTR